MCTILIIYSFAQFSQVCYHCIDFFKILLITKLKFSLVQMFKEISVKNIFISFWPRQNISKMFHLARTFTRTFNRNTTFTQTFDRGVVRRQNNELKFCSILLSFIKAEEKQKKGLFGGVEEMMNNFPIEQFEKKNVYEFSIFERKINFWMWNQTRHMRVSCELKQSKENERWYEL